MQGALLCYPYHVRYICVASHNDNSNMGNMSRAELVIPTNIYIYHCISGIIAITYRKSFQCSHIMLGTIAAFCQVHLAAPKACSYGSLIPNYIQHKYRAAPILFLFPPASVSSTEYLLVEPGEFSLCFWFVFVFGFVPRMSMNSIVSLSLSRPLLLCFILKQTSHSQPICENSARVARHKLGTVSISLHKFPFGRIGTCCPPISLIILVARFGLARWNTFNAASV